MKWTEEMLAVLRECVRNGVLIVDMPHYLLERTGKYVTENQCIYKLKKLGIHPGRSKKRKGRMLDAAHYADAMTVYRWLNTAATQPTDVAIGERFGRSSTYARGLIRRLINEGMITVDYTTPRKRVITICR